MTRWTMRAASITLLATVLFTAQAGAAGHPRLVSVEAAKCSSCHGKLLRGTGSVHPPVADDCSSCHDVQVTDTGTTVVLNEPEPALCLECHDDKANAASGELASPHAPVADSCLNCHTPHSSTQEHLLDGPIPALCLGCHDLEELQPKHGGQLSNQVDCRLCHPPHGGAAPKMLTASRQHPPFEEGECDACHRQPFAGRVRLVARGAKVCTACHGEVADPAAASVHPALDRRRNRKVCVACHDPHMSDNGALLRLAGPDLCATCHSDIVDAARAETGHPAAAEECTTCHKPHDSSQLHLLTEATPALCLQCHDAEDGDLQKAHLGANLTNLQCTTCHTPHGDANRHLLARTVHPPVLDGCDTCHEGAFDKLEEGGESALCLACHDDIGEAATKAAVPHPALEMARCADCHNPHASAQEHLVKAPGGGECLTCHEDQAAGEKEVAHGVIAVVGCRACHEPHGGAREHLLRKDPDQLCLGCHDAKQSPPAGQKEPVQVLDRFRIPAVMARAMASLRLSPDGAHNHPVVNHRVIGMPSDEELHRNDATFKGELHCLTCHDPHKGPSRLLLRWGAVSAFEACARCHPK